YPPTVSSAPPGAPPPAGAASSPLRPAARALLHGLPQVRIHPPGGQPTHRKSLCLGAEGAEEKAYTTSPSNCLDVSNPLDYLLVHAYCRGITRISSPSGALALGTGTH